MSNSNSSEASEGAPAPHSATHPHPTASTSTTSTDSSASSSSSSDSIASSSTAASDLSSSSSAFSPPSSDSTIASSADASSSSASSTSSAPSSDSESSSSSPPPSSSVPSASDTLSSLFAKSAETAQAAKLRGNEHFAHRRFRESIECYSEAILSCPDNDAANLSIYYTNRGASHLMLEDYNSCVSDCTEALKCSDISESIRIKALHRRCQAYEKLDQMQDALNDAKQIATLQPQDAAAKANEARLTKVVNEKNEKMKEEMLGKLKELGNGILGKFGMSLDDFKAQKDPNTGSYSISFGKK